MTLTTEPNDALERALSAETEWTAPAPDAWRRALATAGKAPRSRAHVPTLRFPPRWAGALVAAALFVVGGVVISGALEGSRQESVVAYSMQAPDDLTAPALESRHREPPRRLATRPASAPLAATADSSAAVLDFTTPRVVIRKATIELTTPDVRTAFAKAVRIVSDARAEFVQDSSLTGEGKHAHATLLLRVAADRLGEVLNELRELGEVRSEQVKGEDATARAVDLDARIANEQRFETELLRLLENRADAPLAEILSLRDRISEVRRNIEQMTAQRDHLSGLASLASVLVIIRAADADEAPAPAEGYFFSSLRRAWNDSLVFLSDSAAFVLRTAVGGALIWFALALAFIALRRRFSRPRIAHA